MTAPAPWPPAAHPARVEVTAGHRHFCRDQHDRWAQFTPGRDGYADVHDSAMVDALDELYAVKSRAELAEHRLAVVQGEIAHSEANNHRLIVTVAGSPRGVAGRLAVPADFLRAALASHPRAPR